MSSILRVVACTLLAFYAGRCLCADTTSDVLVFYSDTSKFQSAVAELLDTKYKQELVGAPIKLITDYDLSKVQATSMVISLGNHAEIDEQLTRLPNSVIYVNNTRQNAETRRNNFYTNIDINHPPCRHLRLIKIINSEWVNIGYLSSDSKDERLVELKHCAAILGLQIISATITDQSSIPGATDLLLRDSDVLLALPDTSIYNSHSVKNILLTAYRHRIPVIGFSDNFVIAGALAAVYSAPEHIADQLTRLIRQEQTTDQEQTTGDIPPEYYSVSVNRQVAKSLNIQIQDISTIKSRLNEMEAQQ